MGYFDRCDFAVLVGKTLTEVHKGDDSILFVCDDGDRYEMYHHQDCCESVYVEDISGDLDDLIGSPITVAEESTSSDAQPGQEVGAYDDSFTWTFYRIATAKGWVVIRWFGSSNGYYSERVDFEKR